jgi:hypothetical protein
MLTNSVINATVLANVMGQQIVQMALMRKTVLQVFFLDTLTLIHNQTHCLGLKRATTTQPPAQHCVGSRGWDYFLYSPEDLHNKNIYYI